MKSDNSHDLPVAAPWSLTPRAGTAVLMALLPALLLLEWTSGSAFSLHLFYLVPISLAAWSFGYRAGCAIATVSAGYCVFVAMAMRSPLAPFPPLLWQTISTLVLFMLFAMAIAYHRSFIDRVLAAARLDPESGALTSRELERALDSEARRARRYGRALSLVMLELPSDARDAKLTAAVAETLRRKVRECDLVGRLTRRRFVLVLVECPAMEAMRITARCREAIEGAFANGARFSFGAVTYGGASPTNSAQLLQMAEQHMSGARAGAAPPFALPHLA